MVLKQSGYLGCRLLGPKTRIRSRLFEVTGQEMPQKARNRHEDDEILHWGFRSKFGSRFFVFRELYFFGKCEVHVSVGPTSCFCPKEYIDEIAENYLSDV